MARRILCGSEMLIDGFWGSKTDEMFGQVADSTKESAGRAWWIFLPQGFIPNWTSLGDFEILNPLFAAESSPAQSRLG